MAAADFNSFIRGIERRLIGYLRFATLSAVEAETLFDQTCAELRRRSAAPGEAATFEIARAAVQRFNVEREVLGASADSDELSQELAKLTPKAREALCMATFGPDARESELGKRMLQAAPAPSLRRQMRVQRSTLRSLVLVALSLCLCLGLVAGFAALHSGVVAQPAVKKPPEDWLADQVAEATLRESDSTYGKGALAEPASGEDDFLKSLKLDFEVLVPQKLPRGFRLESIEQTTGEASGLGFTVLRLNYAKGNARLTLFEAEGGFPWRSEFNAQIARNAKPVQLYGTAVLVVSNAFMEDALDEIITGLKPR